MMLDAHCLPFLQMIVLLENSPWHKGFEDLKVKENAPNIYSWVQKCR